MREVFELIARAGATEDCVVVFGESGTGKELACLLYTSPRPARQTGPTGGFLDTRAKETVPFSPVPL